MSDAINLADLGTASSQDIKYIIGLKEDGTCKLISADSLHIYRGQLPYGSYTDIDDVNLPSGIFSITGDVAGTFPPGTSKSLGACKLENWRAVGTSRIQIIHLYWKNESYIRRKDTGSVWKPWDKIVTQSVGGG